MNGLAIMNLAHAIAVVAHDGQSRKGAGEPYINHVERVADSVYGWKLKSIAYLHDTIEDTYITMESLEAMRIPMDIIGPVVLLTRHEGLTYTQFIDRMIEDGNPDVFKVKIADINDNLRDLDATEFWSMRKKYMKSLLKLQDALERSN